MVAEKCTTIGALFAAEQSFAGEKEPKDILRTSPHSPRRLISLKLTTAVALLGEEVTWSGRWKRFSLVELGNFVTKFRIGWSDFADGAFE